VIGMLRGTVWAVDAERVILDVQGVGYLLSVPAGYLATIKPGEEKTYYTHLLVREDDLTLIGFNQREEKELFLQLLAVNGVGPKAALAILSAYAVKQVKGAIVREDAAMLTAVPGIGAKIAKRLILELKEKLKDTEPGPETTEPAAIGTSMHEALDTLLALGFSRNEARDALAKLAENPAESTEDRIKQALRLLARANER
jgi:Holliday junction DNA helicase RuvA